MEAHRRSRIATLLALVLGLLLLPATLRAANCATVLPDEPWVLTGKVTVNAKKVAKAKYAGAVAVSLDNNSFVLADPQGFTLQGSVDAGSKGKLRLDPLGNPLIEYIENHVESGADANVAIGTVTIDSVKATGKVKSAKSGMKLTVTIKIKATVQLAGAAVDSTTVKISLRASGASDVGVAGSEWGLATRDRTGVSGFGSVRSVGLVDVVFGPDANLGLAANEWMSMDDEGSVKTGTYQIVRPGVADIRFDSIAQLEDEMEDLLRDAAADDGLYVTGVHVSYGTYKAQVTFKPGSSMKLKWTAKFVVQANVNGRPLTRNGRFSLNGNGCAAP